MLSRKGFLRFLLSFGILSIVDGDDGGGIGDFDIGDDDDGGDASGTDNTPSAGDSKKDDAPTVDVEAFNKMQETVNAMTQEKSVNAAISEIKGRHESFDDAKVADWIAKRVEENPEEKGKYDSVVAWEMIHLREFAPLEVKNDPINHGRGGDAPKFDYDESMDAFNSGDASAQHDLLENSVSTKH